ncbi:ankyrin repeat-containing domain protein [Coprinopsis sp. MPI-PUGE-AT-0042]|nr:ankyrin repeat-containing domain protein [Coprinopsis sp. MPI-PUGE-AT-0042]
MTSHGCEPRTVLSQASFEGDLAAVTRLLGSGTDYLEVDASGTTSLHWAVSQQHLVIVEALLTHRQQAVSSSSMPSIQIHTLTFNELRRIRPIVTPIELAAHVNNEAIFKLLLKTLEPLVCALTTIQGFNSVWPAAPFPFSPSRGREVVPIKERDLIKNESLPPRQGDGNEVDWWDMFTSFILQLAIKDGKLAVVDMVLRLGANANKGYGPGKFKPLQVAAWCQKDPAFIRLLLKYGADPDAHTNQPPGSPLHIAIQIFNEGAITALLEAGASPNIRFWHITLLGLTCSLFPHNPAFCLRTVRVLLKAGADVNLDPHLMREAARIGNAPLFKELVAWGADITTKREHGSNVVTCMAARRNWGTAQDYHDILDLFHAKYKSRSDLREALLLERYIPFSLLLDFGLNADYPSHVGGFGRGSDFENYVYRLIQKLEPDKLEAVMESVHVLGRPEIRSGWSMAFTKDLADKSQITAEDVAEVLAIVRSLEYLVPAEVPSWEATLALHNVITEYDGPGDEIKGLVEAFLDLGAGLYAKPALAFTAFASRNKDYFLDMVAQSAIYAREEILSCLLRRIDSQADATETSFFARPSWFQQAAFDKARLSHNSNVNAILACLQYAGLPASSRST